MKGIMTFDKEITVQVPSLYVINYNNYISINLDDDHYIFIL